MPEMTEHPRHRNERPAANGLSRAAAFIPLSPIQPALARIVRRIATLRSELFERLGEHRAKRFLIDPTDLPVVLLLEPDRNSPRLKVHRRRLAPPADVRIAGTLGVLVAMVEGRLDGDSLMFNRLLSIDGDVEAAVSLRNALDDLDGTIIDDAAAAYGAAGRSVLAILRRLHVCSLISGAPQPRELPR